MNHRTERDSLGEVRVPEDALYGAQTQRAVENFGLDERRMPAGFIRNLARIKSAAAFANRRCGTLDAPIADAICDAADRVAAGEYAGHFPVSVFQTGSGTSTNMNMNEVLARLASDALGEPVHPNDHVNCSQSSNDVIPSCIQLTTLEGMGSELIPALQALIARITARGQELMHVAKTGRTHLMDAMPLTLGQELGAWGFQLSEAMARIEQVLPRLRQLPIGGSAVGTGVNVPEGFAAALTVRLCELGADGVTPCSNPFSRMAGQDTALESSAALRGLATVMVKISNDLRWMSSGPLAGLGEISLEALQPGSSIMPGKVNPVLPEAVLMICADVSGNDAAIASAAASGNFQLNVMLPLIAEKLHNSVHTLGWACGALERSIAGFSVEHARIESSLASNPILVTALNARIGYEAAAAIAKRCYREQRTVLDVAAEDTGIDREELAALLDPLQLTGVGPRDG
tara:strand:- start:10832 stop:12211 length:1380 start_codon:yes stop_codon:yes gene_type:complete